MTTTRLCAVLLTLAAWTSATEAQRTTPEVRTSPDHAELEPVGGEARAGRAPVRAGELWLRDHAVHVTLTNGFATTTVEQVLVNESASARGATWSFPLPQEAALSELSLWIDGRRVVGEVVAKDEADRIYDEEKDAGREASRATAEGYEYFRVDLARVPAGGEARVAIVYVQPLDVDAGVGRYLYPLDPGNAYEDMNHAFWNLEPCARSTFSIDVELKTAFPIERLHSPSHPGFQARSTSDAHWRGAYTAQDQPLERDFVLFFSLRPDEPARVEVLTHREPGAPEGTFMAVVTPGEDLAPLTDGTDWLFLLDVSGSMKGEKLRTLQRGLELALVGLDARDRFQIVAFSNRPRALTRGWQTVTTDAVERALRAIAGLSAQGGTNVFAALRDAYGRVDVDRATGVVLVSDGVCTVGPRDYRSFIELARRHDVRLFTFVMGNGANERLLGDLATLSGGFAKSVSVRDEVGAHLMLAVDRMSHAALHGVELELDAVFDVHPRTLPGLYLGQQLVVVGRYSRSGPRELVVRARVSGEPHAWTIPIELPESDVANPELERLWALAAIADLEREAWLASGDESEAEAAVTDLALRHSLVTDHTSMVVVADERKALYGLGDDNARRRANEERAAGYRRARGPTVAVRTGDAPLGGRRAAHAPARASRRGGSGVGAVGPFAALPLLALACLRRRRGGRAA